VSRALTGLVGAGPGLHDPDKVAGVRLVAVILTWFLSKVCNVRSARLP
jgi:hypothetical protein